ncbi:GNAT family N-acetyltransferase [Bacillus infantis]|uniref:GNAT family N-acetyltransferase n=1 Tax=Bacillus infantis TaxID=324767 RepID=A0A5D4SRV8_9BACI|nr:GNAT family protein [Bacillus infantis]TYS64882.1 GNAT family N-acetyltransferase [Bacillus infantis]
MYIETERLIIRDFQEEDWREVYTYTSDAQVMEYMPEGVFNQEAAMKFVRENMIEARNYPVIVKENSQLAGHIVFHPYFGTHTYEIGWVMNPHFQNRGLASEAASAVLKHGFEQKNLHRIIATCQPENIASYKVMGRIGLRREGFFKKCIPHGEGWRDEYYYAILGEEWHLHDTAAGMESD